MAKLFSSILFSSILLVQTAAMADDGNISTEMATEEVESSEENEQNNAQTEVIQEEHEKEELSELEKEAREAEQAELRESGVYDEPVEE